jgi:hypothetical protein
MERGVLCCAQHVIAMRKQPGAITAQRMAKQQLGLKPWLRPG